MIRLAIIFMLLASPALAALDPPGWAGVCSRYPWACSASGKGSGDAIGLADRVNREVNRSIRPVTDQALYGVRDHWTLPTGAGDCEDYALLKKLRLIQAGVAPNRLLFMQVLERGRLHLVLVLDGKLALDNLRDHLVPVSRYTRLKMQSRATPRRWE